MKVRLFSPSLPSPSFLEDIYEVLNQMLSTTLEVKQKVQNPFSTVLSADFNYDSVAHLWHVYTEL